MARSAFDVYIDGRDMHYFKQPCDASDVEAPFFLGIFPDDVDVLPHNRRMHGFANHDFYFLYSNYNEFLHREYGYMLDGVCIATTRLPDYEIARISTGQYVFGDDGVATNLWISEFPVGAELAAFEEIYLLARTTEPTARSTFDVYIDGRDLHYFKQPCDASDVEAPFFLGIFPDDVDVLPHNRRMHGFANHDFYFLHSNSAGSGRSGGIRTYFDGVCITTARLPDYEIARISTGQHIVGDDGAITNLWIAEFPVGGE